MIAELETNLHLIFTMKLGSEQHKELFCRSFIDSHLKYEPAALHWPDLDSMAIDRLRGIPFWKEAILTERKAGIMVSTFAKTIDDPLLRDAVALQGREENRHSRLLQLLVRHYQIDIGELETAKIPTNNELAFIDFGFEECLDSFFAFGMFGIAQQANYLPPAMFDLFDPILDEEARHIVFFVNWFTYCQVQRGRHWSAFRTLPTLWHYGRALKGLVQAFGGKGDEKGNAFTATGASNFMDNLTPELFFSVCLKENERRMSQFDQHLLRPQLLPSLAKLAWHSLKLLPQKQGDRKSNNLQNSPSRHNAS